MTFGLNWLPELAFSYMLIFARVGTMLMLMPAIGEGMIPARMRLTFALLFSLLLFPLVQGELPPFAADNLMQVLVLLFHEIAVGLILGGIARLIVSAAQTAGSIMAFQMGLSIAQSADPTQQGIQGALIGSFLSFLGLTLIFATDLHHLILSSIYDSYMVFSLVTPLMFGDAADLAVQSASKAFTIGVQMSAPFIVFGLVFNLGLGILARLMPQVQVFFVAMPANVGIGILLMALLLTMMMGFYLSHIEEHFVMLRGG